MNRQIQQQIPCHLWCHSHNNRNRNPTPSPSPTTPKSTPIISPNPKSRKDPLKKTSSKRNQWLKREPPPIVSKEDVRSVIVEDRDLMEKILIMAHPNMAVLN